MRKKEEKFVKISDEVSEILPPKTKSKRKDKEKQQVERLENNDDSTELEDYLVSLNQVMTESKLADTDSKTQMENIFNAFNKHVEMGKSCFTTSVVRGAWIDQGKFMLGHRNNIPELAMYHPDRKTAIIVSKFHPNTVAKAINTYDQNEPFYGAHGVYVLNVPMNQYAKAWSGNKPLLYGPGPHVIHDKNFKFNEENGFVNLSDNYISHGTINIIRVPAGNIAKVWIGAMPFFLESRNTPYVFNVPTFRVVGKDNNIDFFDATAHMLTHGSLKRLIPNTSEVAVTYDKGQ